MGSGIIGPRKINDVNNIIVVSDIHGGCKLAVCPPGGIDLDDGGRYVPSPFQLKLYAMWREFWDKWVPFAVRGERYCIVVNGDAGWRGFIISPPRRSRTTWETSAK